MITIYFALAISLILPTGYARMISLAQAAFYGIGAYTAAILSLHFHLPFLVTLVFAMFISGCIAMIISSIATRTVDDYFIICTLGIQVIIFSMMNNWIGLTKGPFGISGIPPIEIGGIVFDSKFSFLLLSAFLTLCIFSTLMVLSKSSFGRILRSLSEDEVLTQSFGINVTRAKVMSFTISGMFAAIPGVLYAHYISYIDPTNFSLDESIFILTIVIIGGMKSYPGILIATIFLILLPEGIRFIGLPTSYAANLKQIIYGMILVFMMLKYRKGFVRSTINL